MDLRVRFPLRSETTDIDIGLLVAVAMGSSSLWAMGSATDNDNGCC